MVTTPPSKIPGFSVCFGSLLRFGSLLKRLLNPGRTRDVWSAGPPLLSLHRPLSRSRAVGVQAGRHPRFRGCEGGFFFLSKFRVGRYHVHMFAKKYSHLLYYVNSSCVSKNKVKEQKDLKSHGDTLKPTLPGLPGQIGAVAWLHRKQT